MAQTVRLLLLLPKTGRQKRVVSPEGHDATVLRRWPCPHNNITPVVTTGVTPKLVWSYSLFVWSYSLWKGVTLLRRAAE